MDYWRLELILSSTKKILLSREEIAASIQKAGKMVSETYVSQNLHFIIVMKGALFFAADLMRAVSIPCTFSYIKAKSYTGTERSEVEILFSEEIDYSDKSIILLDDIHDTGNTLREAVAQLKKKNPISIETMVLLEKKKERTSDFVVDYALNEVGDEFLIGYGLDMHEYERNLSDIYSYEGE